MDGGYGIILNAKTRINLKKYFEQNSIKNVLSDKRNHQKLNCKSMLVLSIDKKKFILIVWRFIKNNPKKKTCLDFESRIKYVKSRHFSSWKKKKLIHFAYRRSFSLHDLFVLFVFILHGRGEKYLRITIFDLVKRVEII